MSYDLIYVNGCSYLDHAQGLDYHLSNYFKCKNINRAIKGSCNSRILRSTMRDALRLKGNKVLFVIGFTFLFRTEVWLPNQAKQFDPYDGDFKSYQLPDKLDWFDKIKKRNLPIDKEKASKDVENYLNLFYRTYDEEAEYLKLLTNLLGFLGLCKSNNFDYLVFSAAEKLPPASNIDIYSPFLIDFQKEIESDDRILPLNNFCFNSFSLENNFIPYDFDQYGIYGHHGSDAFEHFAKYLIEKYKW